VTIAVATASSGDFRGENIRQLDILLLPQGVILPTNPSLTANFVFTPDKPQVLQTVSFDASTSTNGGNGSFCGAACTYSWNFGDGTSGSGQSTTHQFRAINNFSVTLTVTDARGATAFITKVVPVGAGTPPSADYTVSPLTPGVNQDVFFDATAARPAAGRTITNYDWSFGDGSTGTGMVTAHKYAAPGVYPIQLTTTDDAGTKSDPSQAKSVTVGPTGLTATPVADLQMTTSGPKANLLTSFNASASKPGTGSNITSYVFNWGDGSPEETTTNPVQTHVYTGGGSFVVTLTVTDSVGRVATAQKSVTIAP
jgi:PKD repeat protein